MEVLGNYSDTQPLQPLLTAAGAMVLVLEYLRATKILLIAAASNKYSAKITNNTICAILFAPFNFRYFDCVSGCVNRKGYDPHNHTVAVALLH